ncbi:MAG TPA: aldo/keto reductase [Bryobacteraceae bacterium]|nr:aldo/keto reductase [Bryobacteraceae bacterium]
MVAHGTWALGGWMWGGTDTQKSVRSIQASLDAGVNFIDTAPAYGLGLSEQIVGEAIRGRRDKVIVATKCGLVWHTAKGTYFVDQDGTRIHRYLGAESIRYEVEQSLRRLETDYIDLYQTHWQDATTPIAETMAALLGLKREGKIRAIGVSNCTVDQVRQYRDVGPVDAVQEKYSMVRREMELDYLPYCAQNRIGVLAYSPLANGLLTGKVDPDRVFPEGDLRRNNPLFTRESRLRAAEMLDTLGPVARKYNLTEGQLAIAWTLAQTGITHALVGARDARQAAENVVAGSVCLSADDLKIVTDAAQSWALVEA